MPDRRLPAGKMADGDGETAFELVVIVAVQDVVLTVVLVVDDRLGGGETRAEKRAVFRALDARAIGVAAPGEICLGKLGVALPAAFVDQRLQTGAVSTRLRAEDAVTGAARRRFRRDALRFESSAFGRDARCKRVDVFNLIDLVDSA